VNRIARRHANFFSEFLQSDRLVQSSFGEPKDFPPFTTEHDLSGYTLQIGNVRAALQWAFSADGDVGVELAISAAPLFIGLSLLEECGRWCERALLRPGPRCPWHQAGDDPSGSARSIVDAHNRKQRSGSRRN
jgi:hypothetical protein